jgi:uncharacterized protein YceK
MIHRHDAAVSTNIFVCLYCYCAAHYLLAAKLENKAGTVVSLTISEWGKYHESWRAKQRQGRWYHKRFHRASLSIFEASLSIIFEGDLLPYDTCL